MKIEPRYGYYPWWPEDGDQWLHPEDVQLARELIPSNRIFRREGESGPFVCLFYGELRIRVKRTLWQEVDNEGYELGDWVEVLSRGQRNTPRTGVICEIRWEPKERRLQYRIMENDKLIPNDYFSDDIRPVEPTQIRLED